LGRDKFNRQFQKRTLAKDDRVKKSKDNSKNQYQETKSRSTRFSFFKKHEKKLRGFWFAREKKTRQKRKDSKPEESKTTEKLFLNIANKYQQRTIK
jgi:hypothetical protein